MPKITKAINILNYEVIRDQIGFILADELPNQATLQNRPYINAEVFIERSIPFHAVEAETINVTLAKGDFNMVTSISQSGTFSYFVDIYTTAKTNQNQRGDNASALKLQRLAATCHQILSNPAYVRLGINNVPMVSGVIVESIQFSEPGRFEEANSLIMARLTVNVRAGNCSQLEDGIDINGSDTTVKLADTEMGYKYIKNV